MTEHEIDLMRHALGVQKRGGKWTAPYRNHFVAGGKDLETWEGLVASGHAARMRIAAELTGGDPAFFVTDHGKSAALAGLKLPATPPNPAEDP